MKAIYLLVISIFVFSQIAHSHGENKHDVDGKEYSEFSWNPSEANTSSRLGRFYALNELIEHQYDEQNFAQLPKLIDEYLNLADIYRNNWNYGNAVHDGNRILGLISYYQEDLDKAALYLVLAGESTGSPQLNSFGPDLELADLLIRKGKTNEVIAYLQGVQKFWEMDNGIVDKWITAIENGKIPRLHRQAQYSLLK